MVARFVAASLLVAAVFQPAGPPPAGIVLQDGPTPVGAAAAAPYVAGDSVPVLARRTDAVQVPTRQGAVWLPAATVAVLADSSADAQLYATARDYTYRQRHLAAIALYHQLATLLPRSPYAPDALLAKGREAVWLAMGGDIKDAHRWDVHFKPRPGGLWQYDGAAYAQILLRYPKSAVAAEALYGQILTDSEWTTPWSNAAGPLGERRRWEFFLSKYPKTTYRPAVWLRWSYLTLAAADLVAPQYPQIAAGYRSRVDARLRDIVRLHPVSEMAARARRAIAFLQGGGHVAGPGASWPFEARF
jgi:hypothetical protein